MAEISGLAVVFDVQVVPRASRDRIGPKVGDRIKIHLTAPPVDGAANAALISLLARAFGVAKRDVEIVRGETGRKKTVRVHGRDAAQLKAILELEPASRDRPIRAL